MNVVFVDLIPPINHKSDIRMGWAIRRYYAWMTLNKMVDKVVPFKNKNGSSTREAIIEMFKKDSKIWVEYPCGSVAHFFVLLASFIRFKKILIIDVHDFVGQQEDIGVPYPFLKGLRLEIVERLLLNRADIIILPCSGLLDYFIPKKRQKVLIMPAGVGEDELFVPLPNKIDKGKKIAIYFGSMQRKDAIPKLTDLFLALEDWELHLIGHKEGQELIEEDNVKYREQ